MDIFFSMTLIHTSTLAITSTKEKEKYTNYLKEREKKKTPYYKLWSPYQKNN